MLRTIQPKTARAKRELARRDSKHVENPKKSLFLRYTSCSQVVQDCMSDLFALRRQLSQKFTKKNSIHPFEDASSLEFFSEKNDASLLLFGSTSKKRPHTITFTRMFDHKVLDMLEVHLDPETYRSLEQFKGRKPSVVARPMVLFAGTAFENPVEDEYTIAKSMLLDFFRGVGGSVEDGGKMDVEGLEYIVSITCQEPSTTPGASISSTDSAAKPTIRLRAYCIRTKRSGGRLPRIEVDEIGPRMDFRVGRSRQPDPQVLKLALKKAKTTEERTKKNVSTDAMGDKLGRIHLGKQDMSDMALRKFKGLKRSRDLRTEEDEKYEDASRRENGTKKAKI